MVMDDGWWKMWMIGDAVMWVITDTWLTVNFLTAFSKTGSVTD